MVLSTQFSIVSRSASVLQGCSPPPIDFKIARLSQHGQVSKQALYVPDVQAFKMPAILSQKMPSILVHDDTQPCKLLMRTISLNFLRAKTVVCIPL